MTERRKRILIRTACVTAIAIVATYVISFSVRLSMGMPIDWLSWVECFVIPLVVGAPIAGFIFTQAETLRAANEKLERQHHDIRKAHERLSFIACHDQMTGLLNREGFLKQVDESRDRYDGGVLLAVDADRFKNINDRYGHAKGDEALRKIANALEYSVRRQDVVGRIGGEEFGILLVGVSLEEGARMAELVRRQVECIRWMEKDPDAPPLSVSIGGTGIDSYRTPTLTALRDADRCLYEAKRRGRNCVSFDYALTVVA